VLSVAFSKKLYADLQKAARDAGAEVVPLNSSSGFKVIPPVGRAFIIHFTPRDEVAEVRKIKQRFKKAGLAWPEKL
jgi:hypothetical protein